MKRANFKRIGVVAALVFAVLIGFKAVPAVAEGFAVASEKVSSIAKDQTVDGSAYLAGESVSVQGTVKGDVYCVGQSVTIDGTVDGDVLCAGQTVKINGTVHGDVRAAAMNIVLKGVVDGSVTLAGSSISTDSASKIGRDATITAGVIDLSGSIARDAVVAGQVVAFNGTIARDARVMTESVSTAASAKIGGNLVYESSNDLAFSAGFVGGKTQRVYSQSYTAPSLSIADMLLGMFVVVIMFVVLTLAVVLVLPRYAHGASDIVGAKKFATYFLVGLVTFVVAPVLALLLLVSVAGVYVAIALGLAIALVSLVGGTLVAYRLGRFMLDNKARPLASAFVGSLALGVIGVVPFIGWLVVFVSMLTGVGMVVMSLKPQYEETVPVVAKKKPAKRS